ncbi:MAG: adenosylcobinamide-phosphate synthase CbiB [Rhizobiaceae bacterium]|nr:adenosylcobinamide-phosphate synthase CbiB [Rhizobiaceae bacterium]
MMDGAVLLFFALILDWFVGDPKWLWKALPHPVAMFGRAVSFLDKTLNKASDNPASTMRMGAVAIVALIIAAALLGWLLDALILFSGIIGVLLEIAIIWIFLAQKSLGEHVGAVAVALREEGLAGGQNAVAMIVGRNPHTLDESGVSRAAIESLAENFSDGVVAPAFWYLVFGLPGLLVYKMINTADSMIGYKNERYLHFGRVAAQIDDLANWLPARISVALIAGAGVITNGIESGRRAISTAMRDAGLHSSPNAGWPEAAMAGACDFALGGPRIYEGNTVSQAFINGAGKRNLGAGDINAAMVVFSFACYALWGAVLIWYLLF